MRKTAVLGSHALVLLAFINAIANARMRCVVVLWMVCELSALPPGGQI
jgi:hypothetical protein